ncbi:hypothetical protein [Nostoc sp.]
MLRKRLGVSQKRICDRYKAGACAIALCILSYSDRSDGSIKLAI